MPANTRETAQNETPDVIKSVTEAMGIHQVDAPGYGAMVSDGTTNYESTNYGGPYFDEDMLLLARFVQQLKTAKENGEIPENALHVDVGTGPNIIPALVSSPYVDRFVAIDPSPSNVARINSFAHDIDAFPEHFKGWSELCAITYTLGDPEELINLKQGNSRHKIHYTDQDGNEKTLGAEQIYDALKNWGVNQEQITFRKEEARKAGQPFTPPLIVPKEVKQAIWDHFVQAGNPYASQDGNRLNKQEMFERLSKIEAKQGGLLYDDQLGPIRELAGKADILSKYFVTESMTKDPRVYAHGEVNWAALAKQDAQLFSVHMENANGYETFGQKFEEHTGTHQYFKVRVGEFNQPEDQAQGNIANSSTAVDAIREGVSFAVVSGKANIRNPDGSLRHPDGWSLLAATDDQVLKLAFEKYYAATEKDAAAKDIRQWAKEMLAKIRGGQWQGHNEYPWDELPTEFWDEYHERNYKTPLAGDIHSLFKFIQATKQQVAAANQEGRECTYIEVENGPSPQYTLAAIAAGVDKLTLTEHSESAVAWQKEELLNNKNPSKTTKNWYQIAQLLSTYPDEAAFLTDCKPSPSGKNMMNILTNWNQLSEQDKQKLLDGRFKVAEETGIENVFRKDATKIKETAKQMHEDSHFQIKKWSVLEDRSLVQNEPADIVFTSSTISSFSEIPSEVAKGTLNIVHLAKADTGTVVMSNTPSSSWKSYNVKDVPPAFDRRPEFWQALSDVLSGEIDKEGHKKELSHERKILDQIASDPNILGTESKLNYIRTDVITPRSEILGQIPDGTTLLKKLVSRIMEDIKHHIPRGPSSRSNEDSISLDGYADIISKAEKASQALGYQPSHAGSDGATPHPNLLAERIDKLSEFAKSATDETKLNKIEGIITDFSTAVHKAITGRTNNISQSLPSYRANGYGPGLSVNGPGLLL